jgi:hypothetical protein
MSTMEMEMKDQVRRRGIKGKEGKNLRDQLLLKLRMEEEEVGNMDWVVNLYWILKKQKSYVVLKKVRLSILIHSSKLELIYRSTLDLTTGEFTENPR